MTDKKDTSADDARAHVAAFHEAVNMPPSRLKHWLETPESKQVGYKAVERGESVEGSCSQLRIHPHPALAGPVSSGRHPSGHDRG